ncbi:hypothetical protein EDB84DRAFT_1442074 [Lactarius hengduanensis]|nr:hypothetical protein EDB84DRAFT_1442074 [Lactarius hengduanensis]
MSAHCDEGFGTTFYAEQLECQALLLLPFVTSVDGGPYTDCPAAALSYGWGIGATTGVWDCIFCSTFCVALVFSSVSYVVQSILHILSGSLAQPEESSNPGLTLAVSDKKRPQGFKLQASSFNLNLGQLKYQHVPRRDEAPKFIPSNRGYVGIVFISTHSDPNVTVKFYRVFEYVVPILRDLGKLTQEPQECLMLTWEVRYLCATLLPHSETRLLPAGIVLLKSLGRERDLSQRENEETRHCSELFIVLTREILLKEAVGIEDLEGPCKLLHLTFRDILFKSGAFADTSTTSNPSETGLLRAPRADTQGPERVTRLLRALLSVLDAFEVLYALVHAWWLIIYVTQAALDMVVPQAVDDEALREHRHQVSRGFSVVRDLTMDQYRQLLGQTLAPAPSSQGLLALKRRELTPRMIPSRDGRESIGVAAQGRAESDVAEVRGVDALQQRIEEVKWGASQPITTIEEGFEAEDEGNFANSNSRSRSNLVIEKRSFPSNFLCRFPLSWILVKKRDK